jgi:hypothetical protein
METENHPTDLQTPDHTRLQMVAVAQAVIAVVIAFGVPITQSIALVALAGVVGTALVAADAAIRRERARNADKLRVMQVTPRAKVADDSTPALVSDPTEADGAVSSRYLMEVLATLERIGAALQPSPSAAARNGERPSAFSPA